MRRRPESNRVEQVSRPVADWWFRKRPVTVWICRFVCIYAAIHLATLIPWIRVTATDWIVHGQAGAVSVLLDLFGENVRVEGNVLVSARFAETVAGTCLALSPSAAVIATVAAQSCSWRHRLLGLFACLAALLSLNVIRIAVLFLLGAHAPNLFK